MIFTIKLKFENTPDKEIVYQDVNLELKQNPKLWGADEVWLDDVENSWALIGDKNNQPSG